MYFHSSLSPLNMNVKGKIIAEIRGDENVNYSDKQDDITLINFLQI